MASKVRRGLLCGGVGVAAIAGVLAGAATGAQADVTISADATQNMSCGSGVCAPTSASAVLNVGDLETLLASGNVTVTTTGSGVQADNIDVTANLGWSANTLTLDAYQSLSVTAPITVKGRSGLSILTNDGGSGGELAFFGKGHVTFKKLSASLAINGTSYRLVNSIATLAAAIQKKPSGNYALAADLDASKDGTYGKSPIQTPLTGAFEGLGNKISKLSIYVPTFVGDGYLGLFAEVSQQGQIRDLGVVGASVSVRRVKTRRSGHAALGILAGGNSGIIARCYSSGTVSGQKYTYAGGLVSDNEGTLTESHSSARVQAAINFPTYSSYAGGLVAGNGGQIDLSYATGSVESSQFAGGLVGNGDTGSIVNSYATGSVRTAEGGSGGLVGYNTESIGASYASGKVSGNGDVGGLVGADESKAGSLSDTYWDTTTSHVSNLSQGAGNIANDPGITGLSTEQFQSGLPEGFDPSIWGENADINGGLPYLLANPPE